MSFSFKHLQNNTNLFFQILPEGWQDEIVPFWDAYKDSSEVYVILEKDQVIGGGIVFSTSPPDLSYYKKEAMQWFCNHYLYIGFLWIAEDKRNKNLGSFWLDELKRTNPEQKYWLLIEDERLHRFYQRNGFVLNKTICHGQNPEWLYVFKPL
ncbi:MAG: GNAT family N-acetyltransferase [Gelidibacter sp.]